MNVMVKGGKPTTLKEMLGRSFNDVEEKNRPKELYYAGPMEFPVPRPRVAIIGTRNATEAGLEEAAELVKVLVRNGVTIVSGLAKGIDTAAHKAAIREGGRTIAVIGTPLDRAFPKENENLQEEIAAKHLVVSEFKVGSEVQPWNFIRRNKTMALISDATVIVESGDRGGALHQGKTSSQLGRPLFMCKSAMRNNNLKWPSKMQDGGAIRLDDYEDVLEYLPSNIKMAWPIST